jgi:hypothetical protein
VDPEMGKLQNGFGTSFSFIRKPLIFRYIYDKNIKMLVAFIVYHRGVVKQDHGMTLLIYVMQP